MDFYARIHVGDVKFIDIFFGGWLHQESVATSRIVWRVCGYTAIIDVKAQSAVNLVKRQLVLACPPENWTLKFQLI